MKVSICIPTYNSAAYVRETIQSVLAQDYDGFELVFCDDASKDDTSEICRSYVGPRTRYLGFEQRGGQAGNWNRCVEVARGEYVVILHADDLLESDFLRRAVAMLDKHDDVGLVHCTVQHIDAAGTSSQLQVLHSEDRISPGEELWRRLALDGCVVSPAGTMVRKRIYEKTGPFTDKVLWGIDWHMWFRIAIETNIGYLATPLARYRDHPLSGTSGVLSTGSGGADELRVLDDVFRRIRYTHPALYRLRSQAVRQVAHRSWCFAEMMCRGNMMKAARANLRRCVMIDPRLLLDAKVPALWLATYFGYDSFDRTLRVWRQIAGAAGS